MSFAGIFRAKNGIAAVVDSKGSIKRSGNLEEDIGRNPEKLFPLSDGVAVCYGCNQILVQNRSKLFSTTVNVEDFIYEYVRTHQTLDAAFFEMIQIKMGTNPDNREPILFIVGRKLWAGNYRIEYHKIGYDYLAMKVGDENEYAFTGGVDVYTQAFGRMDFRPYLHDVEELRKNVVEKLQECIDFYEHTLSYNPVGRPVKSFIVR